MRPVVLCVVLFAACSDHQPEGEQSLIPSDYSSFTEVRDCRSSGDHLLMKVRVLVNDAALGPYMNRDAPFPAGSIILKEEYDPADTTCSGPVENFTVMVKEPDGSFPATLDFQWQEVRPSDRMVITEDVKRCVSCHSNCVAPEFFGYTCANP